MKIKLSIVFNNTEFLSSTDLELEETRLLGGLKWSKEEIKTEVSEMVENIVEKRNKFQIKEVLDYFEEKIQKKIGKPKK